MKILIKKKQKNFLVRKTLPTEWFHPITSEDLVLLNLKPDEVLLEVEKIRWIWFRGDDLSYIAYFKFEEIWWINWVDVCLFKRIEL
jgi:hypothetical protein